MRKVEDGLRGEKDRTARFVSALTLAWPDGHTVSVEGTVRVAYLAPPGRPSSVTTRSSCRWATTSPLEEMDPVEKHQISHRADAFRKLVQFVPEIVNLRGRSGDGTI